MSHQRALLAFSGGLDTSFCVHHLRNDLGYEVTTVTFDCGGLDDGARQKIADRTRACGAVAHHMVDKRAELCERVLTPLIRTGYLKGGNYPYCVGAERGLQAEGLAHMAIEGRYDAVCHGSTGAGNDQIRFDVTLRALLPSNVDLLTPIRTLGLTREEITNRLEAVGIPVERKTTTYSVNTSLWGTTLGGGPLHDPSKDIPRDLRYKVVAAEDVDSADHEVTLGFANGVPVSLDSSKMSMIELIEQLNEVGAAHGIGRDVHTGDTALGIKGRIVFEAPAAAIIHLAHRELMKLNLSKHQLLQREHIVPNWGFLLHEGLWLDPVMRDIEAYLANEQIAIDGEVTIRLGKGTMEIVRLVTDKSRMSGKAQYGESAHGWDGRDAQGFAHIQSLSFRRNT